MVPQFPIDLTQCWIKAGASQVRVYRRIPSQKLEDVLIVEFFEFGVSGLLGQRRRLLSTTCDNQE
jgi:hypothetical protein